MTRALLVAAPHSGTGKTTFCAGLAACLRQRGIRVRCCKVGPDYLDPSWLTLASDRPCINLDLWLHGETSVRRRFQEACRDVDVCLVEGVMGLYDGLQAKEDTGSSAHVARLLGIPVLLLADASGCARSFAALVHGFTSFPQAPSFCGVIANRIGSPRHRRILQDALDSQSALPPLLGTLPQQGMPTLESRHLGLVSARNQNEAQSILDALAGIVAQHVSVDKLLSQAGDIPSSPPVLATPITSPHCRIALACDEAFHFYYSGLEAALQERGCEVARFSPLHDDCLPHDCAGLILGGGYPELYAQTLSLNTAIMQSIQRHCAQGMVIYAECGGLMYLSAGIICGDQRHPLLGILPSWVEMGDRLRRLGYVQAQLQQDCPLGQAGEVLHGHEYHYSHLLKEPAGWEPLYLCRDVRGAEPRAEGWWKGDVTASYVHLALEALPQTLDSWVKHCTQKENFA